MAGVNKKTTLTLTAVVLAFILVIIILCLVPDPCRMHDRRPECKSRYVSDSKLQQTTSTATPSTVQQTTSTDTPTTTVQQTTSTGTSSTTVASTTLTTMPSTSPPTQTSSSSTVTISSSTSSISSTETSSFGDIDATTFSTDISDSSVFTDLDENITTLVSDMTDKTISEMLENDTYTTDTTNMTTKFEWDGTTTETSMMDYETTTENTSTSSEIEETLNTTELSTTVTDETTTEIEMHTTETPETTTVSTTDHYPSVAFRGVCDTEICREVSRRMLDMMDPRDIDPCDDFYQYSCGGVLDDPFLKPEDPQLFADNIIKEALTYGDKDDEELNELFVMYDSCLNYRSLYEEERLEKAQKVFEEIDFNSEDFDLGNVLAKMMKMHFTPFFDISADFTNTEDQELSSKMALPLKSAFTNERAKDVCLKIFTEGEDAAKHKKEFFDIALQYEAYVNCTIQGSGLQARMKSIERNMKYFIQSDAIENSTITILQDMLEKMARDIPPIPEIKRKLIDKDYEEFSLDEIDNGSVFGKLPFNMKNIIEEVQGFQVNDPRSLKILVYSRDEFMKLFETISEIYKTQKPLMQSIMQLLWVEHIYDDLITPPGAAAGSQNYCLNIVTKFMDDYVSYLYLKQMTERNTVESQMKRMTDIIQDLMVSQVKDSMLSMMTSEFANLDKARLALRSNKNDIKISVAENNFAENYITLMKYYRERVYKTLKVEDDTSEYTLQWSLLQFPYKTRVTSYPLKRLLIPHGALSPPYYYEGAPAYINYAGIGHTIAHEILYGFDSKGIKYNGKDNSWMKNDQTMIKNRECLEQQHYNLSSTGVLDLHPYVDLDEVLADVAAPNLAWEAYTKDLVYNPTTTAITSTTHLPFISNVYRRRRRSAKNARSKSAALLSGSHAAGSIHTSLSDEVLIHWENKTIQQIYFIKTAQNQCSSTSGLNIPRDLENVHLPLKLRVNLQMGNNQMFMKAFNCDKKSNPKMKPKGGICSYDPTGVEQKRR